MTRKANAQLLELPLADLVYLRRNPQYMTPHQMEALKASIKRDGFLAPILVRPKGKKYEILSGNRRNDCRKSLKSRKFGDSCRAAV